MAKITLIGAGSVVFAKTLIGDILSLPELEESTISLMDIDEERLKVISELAKKIVHQKGIPAKIESTLERRKALEGANYVIIMIQVGGIKLSEIDINIPLKYGIKQCIGDTLGPGGVFRALRTIPVLMEICKDMEEVCPDAYLLNYSNPMAMNCWAMNEGSRIKNIGLCHSVQGTSRQLASYIGAPYEEISYWVAGINHMSWFLEFKWKGKDAYPLLKEKMEDPEIYEKDPVRFEILRYFNYFVTESSGHMSEYIPYIRKRDELINKFCGEGYLGETAFYIRVCKEEIEPRYQEMKELASSKEKVEISPSEEYGSYIIHSLATGIPRRINGSVRNNGLITNLPQGCAVEVPCLVDKNGIHPCFTGELPPQCAALNRTNINVQKLAVKAALTGDKKLLLQAILLDPLTGAVLSMDEIKEMVEEMFSAEKEYLPQFKE